MTHSLHQLQSLLKKLQLQQMKFSILRDVQRKTERKELVELPTACQQVCARCTLRLVTLYTLTSSVCSYPTKSSHRPDRAPNRCTRVYGARGVQKVVCCILVLWKEPLKVNNEVGNLRLHRIDINLSVCQCHIYAAVATDCDASCYESPKTHLAMCLISLYIGAV